LTLGTSLKLADAQVQTAIAEGVSKMVIDLTSVDFVDSAGLGMLVCTYGALNEKGGALAPVRRCAARAKATSADQDGRLPFA